MNRLLQDGHMYGPGARDSPRFPEPYNLFQFYSAEDGPWIPLSVIQPADTLSSKPRPSAPVYNGGSGAFQDYRSTGLPSECDTAPEDSGYGGSRPTYSIVESVASINDNDRCTETGYLETQTTEQLIGDLNLSSTTPIFKASEMTNQQDHDAKYRCDQCDAFVKTKSELRPYKCNYPDCLKATRGFSTPNDLTRHKRTVHREHNDYGPVYICRHDPCFHKKKLWPRADNFRSHLFRSHDISLKADDDLRIYRYQSDEVELHALRGVGSSVADVDPRPQPRQLQDSPDLRGDTVSTTASGQVKKESSKQSSLLLTLTSVSSGRGSQLTRSNILDDLQLSPVSDTQLLANDGVDMVAEDEVPLADPETALPRNEQREETLDEEVSSRVEDQEEVSGRPEPSTPQAVPPEAPIQSNSDTAQSEAPKPQKTTGGSSEASGTPTEALADPLTLVSRNTSELFTLLKNIPLDMALKDGTSEVLSFLRNIPKDLLEKALKNEDQVVNENDPASDQMDQHKASSTCRECGKLFSRMCELSHLFGKDGMEKKTMNEWCFLEDKLAEGDSQPSKKRKATEDLDVRPSKRSNFIWICSLHGEQLRALTMQ
ncbi:c2h2 type zinc finger domain-containing [Trichoderma arundinaceum]|uniref:C2h2 type zinc finger domain-containing n=1 Tax=Trichoderma arundinaceum TaxID=490622 RepID=A0A395NAQ7_TRIAR|nr:c2h2 type zinc finger domain-containing [Trichoderma arundinaceum]